MVPNVTIINTGTLSMNRYWGETERLREPSATCTLIEAGGVTLLVDPSPQPKALSAMLFAARGIKPGDVDMVFLTHFHGDHRFGLDLFPQARAYMAQRGIEEWTAGASAAEAALIDRFGAAEGNLPRGVELLATPGHTMAHHSLAVGTDRGRLLVAGDAVMTRDFLREETGFHNSVDFARATDTIRGIKASFDLIIPGHDSLLVIRS